MLHLRNTKTGERVDVDDKKLARAWHAGEEGVAEAIAALPAPARDKILHDLGYNTVGHGDILGLR